MCCVIRTKYRQMYALWHMVDSCPLPCTCQIAVLCHSADICSLSINAFQTPPEDGCSDKCVPCNCAVLLGDSSSLSDMFLVVLAFIQRYFPLSSRLSALLSHAALNE